MRIKWLVAVLIVFFSFSCAREEPQQDRRAFTVSAFDVQKRDLREFIDFTSTLKAREEVKVYSRVGGIVYEKLVRSGEKVEKDQVLFTIDRDVVGYKFEKALAESPISGKVSMVYIDTGDRISTQTELAMVQNDEVVKARIWVGGRDYPRIELEQHAYLKVPSYRERVFKGRVLEVSPFFDPGTHTALVEVEFDNPLGLLKPGMFAEISIEVDRRPDAVSILFDSVMKDEGEEYVYVVNNDRAEKRYVETGLRVNEYAEIVSGLAEGEQIIYRGKEFIEDGSKIRVVRE